MVTHIEEDEFPANAASGAEGQNLIKASLFNLIVIANTLKRAIHCQELIHLITEKYPCRVIFVQSDEASQPDFFHLESTVQTVGTGTNRVCFDQITIESSINELHKVPFLILPNIMPDLPVYILLGHDPNEDKVILPELQKYATRVIFDTESIDNFERFSKRMLAAFNEAHCDFIDMTWARTKAWREVMARVFNDAQKLALLGQSKMIQISFCGRQPQIESKMEMQAIFFQAWLAAQLGWTLLGVEKVEGYLRISYRSKEQPITVSLVPRDTEALDVGSLFSVEVMTYNDSHFLISSDGQPTHVTVHASNPERCEMPYTLFLSSSQKGSALVNEIFYQPPSEHYCHMLHMLDNPAWAKTF